MNFNILLKWADLNVWSKFSIYSITYHVFSKTGHQTFKTSNNATWREGRSTGTGKVCCLEVTMCFSLTIDRQGFSVAIVRGLCDVWRNMNAVTFVTDEQNALSLCPPEGPANLVVVRIRSLSVRRMEPHMYPRNSAPSDVYSDMYVKDAVLCSTRQCEPWSTSLK